MQKVKNTSTNKDEAAVAEQPEQPNHTERIKSQVLAKIGLPLLLDRVEVSRHHNGNYRVNIWERPEPNTNIAIAIGTHIQSSYYLKVSDTGEIIHSNPPLDKLCSSA